MRRRGLAAVVMAGLAASAARAEPASSLYRFEADAAAAPSGFAHLPFANPAAPKGGQVRLAAVGTFDTVHPFTLRGVPPGSLLSLTYDTLMVRPGDDGLVRHCLLCESVSVLPGHSGVEFRLHPAARFHDGRPVTADDVAWTFEALKANGHPLFRSQYRNAARVEVLDARTVRFVFAQAGDRALPLLLGDLPVLSKTWWRSRDFSRSTLEPFVASGPYRIAALEAGRHVVLSRNRDYWAANRPVNLGRYNFDTIRYDFYRDDAAALEAFKAGHADIRFESRPATWAAAYAGPALEAGHILRIEVPEDRVSGMEGFVMNTRRAPFHDRRVRAALIFALDFEWMNRVLFHGAFVRTRSYFNSGGLGASGLPTKAERDLLAPYRDALPDEVLTRSYQPPATSGRGEWRRNRRAAMRLLRQAGFRIRDGVLVSPDGRPVEFEILIHEAHQQRVALNYAANLRQLGVAAHVRLVDSAQYQRRLALHDFDMVAAVLGMSEMPGPEQRDFWSSASADLPGSGNLAGIRDPVVDALVAQLDGSLDRAALVARTRALDRVLQWGHYTVPFWHSKVDRIAFWNRFGVPARHPRAGADVTYWWIDPVKAAKLHQPDRDLAVR